MKTSWLLLAFASCAALARLAAAEVPVPLVFVARQIPPSGTVYWNVPNSLPGAGPYSRFQVAAPGQLLVRETNGSLRVLVDGGQPTAASLQLIDVNAPDVSYDGQQVVFAGLPQGNYSTAPLGDPGAWRLYVIRADGSGLRQLTFSDRTIDLAQFGNIGFLFDLYDDTDPCWLPDGRVVFSSTRAPSKAMYGGVRTTQLFVVNTNGGALHRITSERNGADRPQIDPLTGRVVFSRWWRNFRQPTDSLATVPDTEGGEYRQHLGLLSAFDIGTPGTDPASGGTDNLKRNAWHLGAINPDGTELRQFAGQSVLFYDGEDGSHAYGGAFAADGTFFANYFPMKNMTEASGFGGIRRYVPGGRGYTPVLGVTRELIPDYASLNPVSYGVFAPPYAAEPCALPDGRLVISWTTNVAQDYGLHVVNADGTGRALLHDGAGTTELRARVLAPRALPPVLADRVTNSAPLLPPLAAGPYDTGGTFLFDCLNVYFNAPVDTEIISAIPVGSAGTIRFFIDHQRRQPGSQERVDWPILLSEVAVREDGSIPPTALPADVPLFEQLRTLASDGYRVPLTHPTGNGLRGAAHVGGHNYGRPGERANCVGCHAGHSMIPVPSARDEALFSNLAPGAQLSASSGSSYDLPYLVDRRQFTGNPINLWTGATGETSNQWVQLVFPTNLQVRNVRLWSPRQGGPANITLGINAATVILYRDAAATDEAARRSVAIVSTNGTDVTFADVPARAVRVRLDAVHGSYGGVPAAGLGEVEVMAKVGLELSPPRPRLLRLVPGAPDRVDLHAVAGWQYGLEHTLHLSPPAWQPVTNRPGLDGVLSLPGRASNSSGFYRVTIARP